MSSSFVLILPFVLTTVIHAADASVFRGEITLVKVEARVYDRATSQPIRNLQSSDFAVCDEDQPRDIVYFGDDSSPLDVLLLLDVSGSMRELLPSIAAQAVDALGRLRPDDRVAVMAFAKSWTLLTPFSADFRAAAQGISRAMYAQVGTDTDISKAVVAGALHLQFTEPGRRRVILIMTDNVQDTNTANRSVENELFEADAVLDALVLRGRIELPRFLRAGGVFRFAARTGGEVIESNSPDARVGEMLMRIRTRYAIHFRPVDTHSPHPRRIRVELTAEARRQHPNAIVRARNRYYPRSEPGSKRLH